MTPNHFSSLRSTVATLEGGRDELALKFMAFVAQVQSVCNSPHRTDEGKVSDILEMSKSALEGKK